MKTPTVLDNIESCMRVYELRYEDILYVASYDKEDNEVSCSWEKFKPIAQVALNDWSISWRVRGKNWEIYPDYDNFLGEYSAKVFIFKPQPPEGEVFLDSEQ